MPSSSTVRPSSDTRNFQHLAKHGRRRAVTIRGFGQACALTLCLLLAPLAAVHAVAVYDFTDLGALGGTYSFATAINASGQVTGVATITGDAFNHAFVTINGVMTDLGTLGGSNSQGTAINASGQVTGNANTTGDSSQHAFVTINGVTTDLGALGGTFSSAAAINASGQVTGYAYTTGDAFNHAFVTINGVMTDLGTLGGSYSQGSAINASGQVTGVATITGDAFNHAFVTINGVMTDLGTLGGSNSQGVAINDAGQVTGYSDITGNSASHAFVTINGVMTDMGTLGGAYSTAVAINASGQVVGTSDTTVANSTHAFVTINGVMTDLGTLGGLNSFADAINASGQVVGLAATSGGVNHAFVTINGILTDLNSITGGLGGFTLTEATAINDSGTIVGYGLTAGGLESHAFILTAHVTALAATHWLGGTDATWSGANWASDAAGTPTVAKPTSSNDITFAAAGAANQVNTNLDTAFTLKSLTIESNTGISTATTQTLTVNQATTVNALLSINNGVTLSNQGDVTVSDTGTLRGAGAISMAVDHSIFINGSINVGDASLAPAATTFSLTTSGSGAVVMGVGSVIAMDLFTGAGSGGLGTSDTLNLHGTLNATAGGSTLYLGNPNHMSTYAGGDQWKLVDLNSGAGTITGHIALNDSSLGLTTGFTGSFDQSTGIYSIADHRPEITAQTSGLPMANVEGQMLINAGSTVTNDINNHLFVLRAGDGEEDANDSIAALMDEGVVVGQGDGNPDAKSPMAQKVLRSRQWEVFTTVNYGNVKLNAINNQAGVQIDAWAPSVGIERHVSRGLAVGFAATFLTSDQNYTAGLGRLHLEGPALSAYVSFARKNFWSSLLYSFGDYELDSRRNPGFGFAQAMGTTQTYTNSVQYNTGWNFRFQNNTLVTGPFAGVDYLHGTVNAYSETGGGLAALSYGRQTYQSLVTRVGWSATKKMQTSWAAITPQVRLSYERQNLTNNGTSVSLINAPFTAAGGNQSPGQSYLVAGAGVNFQFNDQFSLLLNYQTQIFRDNMQAHFASVRLGYKF